MDDLFQDGLARLLGHACDLEAVRAVEAGGGIEEMWREFEGSGFLDALVPEVSGGAGLSLIDARSLFFLLGRYATPGPLAHAVLVRAAAAQRGISIPGGPVTIASHVDTGGVIACRDVPFGKVSQWALVPMEGRAALLPIRERRDTGVHGSLRANLTWADARSAVAWFDAPLPWREAGAIISAGAIAGGLDYLLTDTVRHVNDRVQFGRSIGKFQAVQQQVSVLASRAYAARMAAEIGCESETCLPEPLRAATARAYASEAAALCAGIAHGLHGAIGITAEYDLQIYTRRLHEARADYGSELYWNQRLGRALVDAEEHSTLTFMLASLTPAPGEAAVS